MLANPTPAENVFNELLGHTLDHIVSELGRDCVRIRRLDVYALLAHPFLWQEPERVARLLGRRLNDDNPLCHTWLVMDELLQLHLLGSRQGIVMAMGNPTLYHHAAYLLFIQGEGLEYHPPLPPETWAAARQALRIANADYAAAMEEELAVAMYLVNNIDQLIEVPNRMALQQIKRLLRQIHAGDLESTLRADHIAQLVGRIMALFHAAAYRYEDAVSTAVRALARQSANGT